MTNKQSLGGFNLGEAKRQGYASQGGAMQAAHRASRWMRRPGSAMQPPPAHITLKIRLLVVG